MFFLKLSFFKISIKNVWLHFYILNFVSKNVGVGATVGFHCICICLPRE